MVHTVVGGEFFVTSQALYDIVRRILGCIFNNKYIFKNGSKIQNGTFYLDLGLSS